MSSEQAGIELFKPRWSEIAVQKLRAGWLFRKRRILTIWTSKLPSKISITAGTSLAID
jgi:hypothetical protein